MHTTVSFLLAIVLLLASCGGQAINPPASAPLEPNDERVSIVFAAPDWELQWGRVSQLVETFETHNPDIHIILKPFSEVLGLPPGEFDVPEDYWLRLASEADAFQIIFQDGIARHAVFDGLVRDLRPLMETDSSFHADDFYPGSLELSAWDGGIWALPTALDYGLIAYNAEAFKTTGVASPKAGWTWNDFVNSVQALSVTTGDQVTRWGFVTDRRLLTELIELSAGPLLDDTHTPPMPRFNEPKVLETVQWWVNLGLANRLWAPDPLMKADLDRIALVEQGHAAMASVRAADLLYSKKHKRRMIGVVDYPITGSESRTTPLYVEQVAMSRGTVHPEVVWRWLDFLSRQPPGQATLPIPARRSVAQAMGFWDGLDEELRMVLRFAIEHAASASLGTWGGDVYGAFNDELGVALNGDKSVEEAMTTAQGQAVVALKAEADQRAVATPAPVAVATTGSETVHGTTTITFVVVGEAVDLKAFRDVVKQFHATHPAVAVEVKNLPFPSDGIANLAGQADCFQVIPQLDNPKTLAAILSLEPFLEAETSFGIDDFFPVLLDQYRWGGRLWGLPAEAQPYVIEYNQDLFQAAGLEPPGQNWTLNDFVTVAQALTQDKAGGKQYGFVGINETLDLAMFVERLGGRIFDDTQNPPAAAFDDQATVKAVRWYADLYLRYGIQPGLMADEEREALTDDGRAAMWTGSLGRHKAALRVGILPFPIGSQAASVSIVDSTGYFISAQAIAPEACWEWIKFMTTEVGAMQGLPARRSVATSEAYRQQVGDERADAYLAAVENGQRLSVFQRVVGHNWLGAYLSWLDEAYQQIVEGDVLPEETLATAQKKADDYRACIISNDAFSDAQGCQACLGQVNQAYPEPSPKNR